MPYFRDPNLEDDQDQTGGTQHSSGGTQVDPAGNPNEQQGQKSANSGSHFQNLDAYLKNNDVVIGPASDGGYYLLAMKQAHYPLFQNIEWSTDEVLRMTLDICTQLNLTVHLLPQLSDVDNEHDLSEEQKIILQINPVKND